MARIPRKSTGFNVNTPVKQAKVKVQAKTFSPSELKSLSKQQIISELVKSPHGNLSDYNQVGLEASTREPDFFAHLATWNHFKGEIRDAKQALPLLSLAGTTDEIYQENALGLLADLDPRSFAKALRYSRELKVPQRTLRRLVERYLRDYEANSREFERVATRHTPSLLELYAKFHIKPADYVNEQLFGKRLTPQKAALARLKIASAVEAAGLIMKWKLPYLQLRATLGERFKEPDIMVAVIQRMSSAELINNMKSLEKAGVMNIPAARAALESQLVQSVTKGTKASSFKATKAAEQFEEGSEIGQKLRQLQEKQIDTMKGVEGNWLVLGDKSTSMTESIELAREACAALSRLVKGEVHLVFEDTSPQYFNVTGKSLEEIKKLTRGIRANGATSLGTGLANIIDRKILIDGIALVSDGAENTIPSFANEYQRYVKFNGNEPTVYWYRTKEDGHPMSTGWIEQFQMSCKRANIDVQGFDLRQGADYYSLPNLVQTMRVGRYGLLDEILATELVTIDQVLERTKSMRILRELQVV